MKKDREELPAKAMPLGVAAGPHASTRARTTVLILSALAVLAGCGTPLDKAEDAYSIEESTARKSYIIVRTAFVRGKATEAQMAEARQLYDAYFEAQSEVYAELTAARAEGDVTLSVPGRQEKVARHVAEVTRTAFLLAKLAKEVTK
jgi:hypothetical protein